MGQSPSTTNNCTFPFITPINSTQPCSITCASSGLVSPQYEILNAIYLIFAWGAFIRLSFRIPRMIQYIRSTHKSFLELPAAHFLFCALIFTLAFGIEQIDWMGFRNLYPLWFYNILDEITASFLAINGLIMVEFWVRMASSMHHVSKYHNMIYRSLMMITIVNFVGFELIGVNVVLYHDKFNAAKLFNGSLLMASYWIFAYTSIRSIIKTLKDVSNQQGGGGGAGQDPDGLARSRAMIHTIQTKFRSYTIIVGVAGILMFASAMIDFTDSVSLFSASCDLENDVGIISILIHALFALGCFYAFKFFNVPKLRNSSGGNNNNNSGGGSNSNNKRVIDGNQVILSQQQLQGSLFKSSSMITNSPVSYNTKSVVGNTNNNSVVGVVVSGVGDR
jgi:hypothetical protein